MLGLNRDKNVLLHFVLVETVFFGSNTVGETFLDYFKSKGKEQWYSFCLPILATLRTFEVIKCSLLKLCSFNRGLD